MCIRDRGNGTAVDRARDEAKKASTRSAIRGPNTASDRAAARTARAMSAPSDSLSR